MSTADNPGEIFSRPQTEARIYDLEQFGLWTDTPGRQGWRARMVFGERNGAPRISVFTGLEAGPKVLYVGIAPEDFWMFLTLFEEIARGENGQTNYVDNMDFPPGQRPEKGQDMPADKMVVRNRLVFGKNQEGICWLGVEQENVPNIRFPIRIGNWHRFYRHGQRLTPGEASVMRTISMIAGLKLAYQNYIGRLRPYVDYRKSKKDIGTTDMSTTAATTFTDNDFGY